MLNMRPNRDEANIQSTMIFIFIVIRGRWDTFYCVLAGEYRCFNDQSLSWWITQCLYMAVTCGQLCDVPLHTIAYIKPFILQCIRTRCIKLKVKRRKNHKTEGKKICMSGIWLVIFIFHLYALCRLFILSTSKFWFIWSLYTDFSNDCPLAGSITEKCQP